LIKMQPEVKAGNSNCSSKQQQIDPASLCTTQ